MSNEEIAKTMSSKIYKSGLFGVYGTGNFDLTEDEFAELLFISMGDDNDEIKQFYERIK